MKQFFCPTCGHRLNANDSNGVAAFIHFLTAKERYTCNNIDCINGLLESDYMWMGIVKPNQGSTCDGDCA